MTIYIVVSAQDGSKQAVAAFSSEEKRKAYLEEESIESPLFDFFEVTTKENQPPPARIFAAHTGNPNDENSKTALAGYFDNKFDAQAAVKNGGFVSSLNIDLKEDEEISLAERDGKPARKKPKKKRKKRPPSSSDTADSSTQPPLSKKTAPQAPTKKGGIILAALILVLIFSLYLSSQLQRTFDFAENRTSVEWLPSTCSDISYFLSDTIDVYEFTISEQEFRKWASSEKLKIAPIRPKQPHQVRTYRLYADVDTTDLNGLPENEQWEQWSLISRPTIQNGLRIVRYDGTEKLTVEGGYNRDTSRAYYWCRRAES